VITDLSLARKIIKCKFVSFILHGAFKIKDFMHGFFNQSRRSYFAR